MIDARPQGAVDATGYDSDHASAYYRDRKSPPWRKPSQRRCYWKQNITCHIASYLWAATTVTQGPSQDSPAFRTLMPQAARRIHFYRILADKAYDAEHNHALCRKELGIPSTVIPVRKRYPTRKWPRQKYRRQMKRRFFHACYGQRWHVESSISQHKRRLGAKLHARNDDAQIEEANLRSITHNLMLIRRAA